MERNKNIKYGSSEWRGYQYEQAKKANRGHNYQYYSEKLAKELEEKGYQLYKIVSKYHYSDHATYSELQAKEIVEQLRSEGNYARIIAGLEQNQQRTKMFSIFYKKK